MVLLGVSTGFSQDLAKAQAKKEFLEAKQKGIFEFVLPQNVSEEQVDKSARFYTKFFKVKFDDATKKVVFNMVNNDENSRNVIIRFFVSLDINKISMEEGEAMSLDDFRTNYLN